MTAAQNEDDDVSSTAVVRIYNRYAWTVVACQSAAFFMAFFHRALYAPLIPPMMIDLDMSFTEAGLIITAFFIGYAMMQIPVGYLADRYGGRILITISMLAFFVPTVMMAFISDWVQGAICRFFTGVGTGMIFVPGVRLIGNWFTRYRRATAMGIWSAFGSLGSAMIMIVAPIIATTMSWRSVYILTPLPALAIAPIFWMLVRATPEDRGLPSATRLEQMMGLPERQGESAPPTRSQPPIRTHRDLLRLPSLWLMCTNMFFWVGILNTTQGWMPTTLVEYNGLPLVIAGILTFILSVVGIMGGPLCGAFADRFGRKRAGLVGLTVFSTATLIFSLLPADPNYPALILVLIAVGVVRVWNTANWVLVAELGGVRFGGLATGIVNTVGMIGASAIPGVCGYLLDAYHSFPLIWMVMAGLLAASLIPMIFVKER